jgi:hypothetical protein
LTAERKQLRLLFFTVKFVHFSFVVFAGKGVETQIPNTVVTPQRQSLEENNFIVDQQISAR